MIPSTLLSAMRERMSGLESAPLLTEPMIPQFSPGEYVDQYAPKIEDLLARRRALGQSLMARKAPEMGGIRPGAAGLALLGALAAKLAGANNSDINSGIGGFMASANDMATRRYQNDVQGFNTGVNADRMRMDGIGDEMQVYQGLQRDSRNAYERNVDRTDRQNERWSDHMNALERDRANREFKGTESEKKRRFDGLKAVLAKVNASERPAVIGQMGLGLDPEAIQAMDELNASERLAMAGAADKMARTDRTKQLLPGEVRAQDDKHQKVQADVQRTLGGIQLDDARKQQILQRVQYYPLEYQNKAANILSQIEKRKQSPGMSEKTKKISVQDIERLRKIVQDKINAYTRSGFMGDPPAEDLAELYRLNQLREEVLNTKVWGDVGGLPPAQVTLPPGAIPGVPDKALNPGDPRAMQERANRSVARDQKSKKKKVSKESLMRQYGF